MDRAASALAVGVPPSASGRPPGGTAQGPPGDRPPRRRRPRAAWVVAAVVLAGVVVGAGRVVVDRGPAPLTAADVDRAAQQAVERARREQRAAPPDAAVAYRAITPSLVTVTAQPPGGAAAVIGAGVVIRGDGAVLTALHVVRGAADAPGGRVTVRFADGTTATATVAGRQPTDDVALLQVDTLPQVVVPAVMGGGVSVGDPVFAVGDPLGLVASLTAGVVSAVDRQVPVPGGGSLARLIQFDAAVNPGSSGGPLLDRDGQVVGIVTGLPNPSAQPYSVGVGFAVPIATAGGPAGLPQR